MCTTGDIGKFDDYKDDSKKKNQLIISETFKSNFDLQSFLLTEVLENDFESKNDGIEIKIENNNDLIETIIGHTKSKKYIGVGVGGVFIHEVNNAPCVLLYKRYHDPENQVWSILGGSSKIHEKIEITLTRKISRITSISQDAISVKDIIRANNHDEKTFHYLSPAFYIEIINLNRYLCWGEKAKKSTNKKKVAVITKVEDLFELGQSTYENPLLAWVPIEMIDGQVEDAEGNQVFSFTTIQAIRRHRYICNETLKLINATNNVSKFNEWRVGDK